MNLSCALPATMAHATCAVTPSSVTPSSATAATPTVTITTTAPTMVAPQFRQRPDGLPGVPGLFGAEPWAHRHVPLQMLWLLALATIFSGFELGFFLLIGTVGLLGLWEYFRMLDHKGLPNFKLFGMGCGAVLLCGSFVYFRQVGVAQSADVEMTVLVFFLLGVFALRGRDCS